MNLITPCQPLQCLVYNLDANEPDPILVLKLSCRKDDLHQENAIGEASKGIHLAVPVRKPGARGPFAHDCGA